MNIYGTGSSGTAFDDPVKVVVVSDGGRGPRGLPGEPSTVPGAPGASIVVLGRWQSGDTYCPLDAVSAPSTASAGILSLYVQRSDSPCAVSDVPPRDALTRWTEVGAADISNITGAIWKISQINHGFTRIGQPVAFSYQSMNWVLADNRRNDETAIALVREVVGPDEALLQTTGEIPNIDPAVIHPDTDTWDLGRLYYVSTIRGRLTRAPTPTNDPATVSQPILMPTRAHSQVDDGTQDVGVALPWRPERVQRDYRVVGQRKFYFTAAGGEVSISGLDLQNNVLTYQPGTATEVFLNGVNLSILDDYVALDGESVEFDQPLTAGDYVEIWTPDQPLSAIVPATALKIDTLEYLFDGVTRTFPLTVDGGTAISIGAAPNAMIWIDANPQEPITDYQISIDPEVEGGSLITFTSAPCEGERFWGLAGVPLGLSGATEWVEQPLAAGVEGFVRCRYTNGRSAVQMRVAVDRGGSAVGSGVIATLGEAYRPIAGEQVAFTFATDLAQGGDYGHATVGADGVVTLRSYADPADALAVSAEYTWSLG